MGVYKCENQECGNVFKSNIPLSCPKCETLEFSTIHIKSNQNLVKYGILILLIGAVLFFLKNDNNPNTESNIVKVEGNHENVEDSELNIDVEPIIIEENNSDIFTEKVEIPTIKKTIKTKKEIPIKKENLTETEYWERGNKYYDKEKYLLAIKDYTQAINLSDYYYYNYYYKRGMSYFYSDQEQNAIDDFDQAIELSPTSEAYYFTGSSYSYLYEYDKAIDSYTKSLRINPNDDAPYLEIGICNFFNDEFFDAKKNLSTYIKRNKDNPRAYYYRGKSFTSLAENDRTFQGYYRDALDDYNSYLDILPDANDDIYYFRGEAFCMLDQYNNAIKDFDYYINNVDGGGEDEFAFWFRAFSKEQIQLNPCEDYKKACDLGYTDSCEDFIDFGCN